MIGHLTIRQVMDALQDDLRQELREQGHYLTGHLEESIISRSFGKDNSLGRELYAENYIDELNTGVAPENINVHSPAYINGLIQYSKLRFGASDEEAVRIAYAIAHKHAKEGMPTHNSYSFSANGRRTEALKVVLEDTERVQSEIMEHGLSNELDGLLEMGVDVII